MSKIHEIEIVINGQYGGFSLDTEMALWLMENKGWTTSDNDDKNTDLIGYGDYFCKSSKYDDIEFRTHPDLIECVRHFHKKYKDLDWTEHFKVKALDLNVKTLGIYLEVEDYHDGKEKVHCWTLDK